MDKQLVWLLDPLATFSLFSLLSSTQNVIVLSRDLGMMYKLINVFSMLTLVRSSFKASGFFIVFIETKAIF
jgi:hypothetical protein